MRYISLIILLTQPLFLLTLSGEFLWFQLSHIINTRLSKKVIKCEAEIVEVRKERNYSQIIIKTIFVTVDFISLRYGYADNKFQQALEQHRADLEKSPIQQKLIDLTKNIIKNGDIDYEFVKDTLYNIAGKAEYDMFEDIWNLINHLGR